MVLIFILFASKSIMFFLFEKRENSDEFFFEDKWLNHDLNEVFWLIHFGFFLNLLLTYKFPKAIYGLMINSNLGLYVLNFSYQRINNWGNI